MEINGKCVFGGIAIGRIAVYDKGDSQVKRTKVSDVKSEIARFEAAKEEAKAQLAALYEKALVEVGEVNAAILEVHQMMLDDLDYVESIKLLAEKSGVAIPENGYDDSFSKLKNTIYEINRETAKFT